MQDYSFSLLYTLIKPQEEINNMTKEEGLEKLKLILEIRGLASQTRNNYKSAVIQFIDFTGKEDMNEITLSDCQNYIAHMIKKGYKPRSINTNLCAVRYFTETVLNTIYSRRQFPNIIYGDDQVEYELTVEDVRELLDTDDIRMKLIVMLGADAGLRISEVPNLKIGDVDVRNMTILISDSKRHRTRRVKLSERLLEMFREYWKVYGAKEWSKDDYIFKSSHIEYDHVCTQTVSKWFREYLNKKGFQNKNITYHSLRHFFATSMIENGCDIFLLKKLLGHASFASTSRYLHYTTKDVESALSLSDKLNF